MKKILIILLISCLTFFSITCKKDSVDNIKIGTIKADINGSSSTFSVQAKATNLSVSGGYGIQIQGNYRTGSTTNLTLVVMRPSPITTGVYTENANNNPLVTMTHCTEVIVPCVIRADSYKSPANPVSINITEITGSSVRGTFKGELQSGSNKEVYSNGLFYVSF
jgi:hypothetical protein